MSKITRRKETGKSIVKDQDNGKLWSQMKRMEMTIISTTAGSKGGVRVKMVSYLNIIVVVQVNLDETLPFIQARRFIPITVIFQLACAFILLVPSILFTEGASTSSNKDDVKRDRNNRDRHSDSGNSSSDSDSTRSSIRESREKERKKHSKKEVKEKKEKKEKKGKDKKDKDKKKKHKKDRKVSQMRN